MRRSGSGIPVRRSSSTARARAWFFSRPSCSSSTSPIWLPTVYSGFSAVIGSWKIIAIRLPRSPRISRSDFAVSSSPPKRMRPVVTAASTSRSTDSAVTDLPEPDSPTSANFSPGATVNETSSTTVEAPKRTVSPSISSKGFTSGMPVAPSIVHAAPKDPAQRRPADVARAGGHGALQSEVKEEGAAAGGPRGT